MANPAWVKGVSGNPKGRPRKGKSLTDILERILKEKQVTFRGKQITGKEAAVRKLLELALAGDVPALKYLIDRIDGRPNTTVKLEDESTDFLSALTEAHRIRERQDHGDSSEE